jgi:formylglycine-generating enzyme required for sulfatase activity
VRESSMRRQPLLMAVLLLLGACGTDAPAPGSGEREPPAAAAPPNAASDPTASSRAVDSESPEARRKRLIEQSKPAVPEWQPELPKPDAALSVAQRLEQAQSAFEAGRVDRGEDNALGIYLEVLREHPEQADAVAGLDLVARQLFERAELALTQGLHQDASRDVAILQRIRKGDAEVAVLQQRIDLAYEIDALFAEAQRLEQSGALFEPEGDNAVELFTAVLERDPAHAAARAELGRIEAELVAQATAAAEAGDYARSDQLLADATRIQAGSNQVQDASTRIVELRQGRAGELLQQANEALARRDVARAQHLLGQLEQVSAQAQGLEELRLRIEQGRLYGGHAPGQSLRDPMTRGGAAPELVVIPVGRFLMGSPGDESDRKKNEGPQHEIAFAQGFALARTEISVAEFARFVEATGHVGSAENSGQSTIYDERTGSMAERRNVDWRRNHAGARAEPDLPVVHVSWEDAKAYADWLSRETGASYRLPSEAEFEYALRAGGATRYAWGDGAPTRIVANLTGAKDRSESGREWTNAFAGYGDGFWGAAPVRAYRANAFGVHDMEGNVSEWVEDCWHDNYARAPGDGSAWVNPGCKSRVIRGASWASAPDQARAAFRLKAKPTTTNARVGFRVVRDL